MGKVVIFTDPHFCCYSSILRTRGKEFSTRLENQISTMNWLNDLGKQYNAEALFCLGDFFDKPELNAEEITALSRITFDNYPTVEFIVGNHEMGRANLEYSSAHAFLSFPNCVVESAPTILGFDNTLFYILPYQIPDTHRKTVMDYFPPDNQVPSDMKKVLLMHNDIKGVTMGRFTSTEGFDKEDLSRNFYLTVNGHIHNHSFVTNNVINLGNITGQNFSEDGFKYPHYCMVLDTETCEYSLIENPYAINFYRLDFTNADIDTINSVSFKLKNAVVSVLCSQEDFQYIKKRFDPTQEEDKLVPRNCNILAARIVQEMLETQESCADISDLHLDHVKAFQEFVMNSLGTDHLILSELQEVVK